APRPQMMVSYDPAVMAQAAAALKQGIALAPERLDMRMGLAKSYEMAGQPGPLLQTIRETLEARKNGGKPWLWRDGVPLPGPEEVFLPSAIEPFASNYWKQPGDKGLENGRPIAELLEQYFPQNSLGYFNMGVYYAHLHKTQESYEKMQQADALDPNDMSTLMNLTRMAIELKQKDKALAYQERLRKLPNGGPAADSFASALQKL
ncbi:tetratricopeptide repeat protein, partial [Hymenobacter agri]